jgi:hypothetical protein
MNYLTSSEIVSRFVLSFMSLTEVEISLLCAEKPLARTLFQTYQHKPSHPISFKVYFNIIVAYRAVAKRRL